MSKSTVKQSANSGKKRKNEDQTAQLVVSDLCLSIIESLSIGVVAFDRQLKIILSNSQACKLIDVGDYIDQSLASGTDSNIWGNWTELLKSAISEGQKSEFESVRYNLNGRKRLLHIVCTPLKQGKGLRVLGGAVSIEDVTEKINIENQLSQAERLAAVGRVAGKVAHELNNPMDGILRYVNLALRVLDKQDLPKPKEYLEHCRTGLMRMVQIISELLEFSRSTYSVFEYAAVDKVVEDAVRAVEPRAGQVDIKVIRDCPGAMPQIRGDSLFQVFCNLIKNAVDAMQGRGRLEIMIKTLEDTFLVRFRDYGPGFPPENAEAIFEPFFTTKSRGGGTGLGLAICKDLVEKCDGRITAENAPDGGSIFTVHLPMTREKLSQKK